MPSYVSTAIFEDAVRELFNEIVRLNTLVGGEIVSDLSSLSSGEVTVVDAINDSYPRYKILQGEIIKLPSYCVWAVPDVLQIEGLFINDGLVTEV
jgi:hypothetical protein